MTDLEAEHRAQEAALLDAWGADLPTLQHVTRWGFDLDAIAYRLRQDQQFALEMRLCKEWRIPHSEFLSWTPEDQAKALGHYVFEAQRCDSCGIHPTDWPDPDEPDFEVATRVCPGCAELDRWNRWVHEQMESTSTKDAADGVKPYLKRREP